MNFDVTALVIFLLAILPGFLAQQSRHSIIPRSLKEKSVLEETGDYVLNSVLVHVFLLLMFRLGLFFGSPSTLEAFGATIEEGTLSQWTWEYRYLLFSYFVFSLIGGTFLGFFRGALGIRQPLRERLRGYLWFRKLLKNTGIIWFLQEEPVWYGVLKQDPSIEHLFVEVKMKHSAGFYSGELRSYGILDDSVREKDFYIVNTYFKHSFKDSYTKLQGEGVLLNFGDVESITVIRTPRENT